MGTHTGARTDGPSTGAHHAVPVSRWRARLPVALAVLVGIVLLAAVSYTHLTLPTNREV